MNKYFLILLSVLMMGGCVPKVGKDILIEPQGNIRLESSRSEVMIGMLSLLGVSTRHGEIRLGSDLHVSNKWHSDIKVVSLVYALSDGEELFAEGEALSKNKEKFFLIPSGGEKNIPLEFRIDTKQLSGDHLLGILRSKHKLFLKGEAVIEIWGIEKHYPFEKEVSNIIQKALSGV